MTSVHRTFAVDPPPARVLEYLKDFGNAVEWDPGTESCERIDDGPLQVGATWRNVSKVFGNTTELTYKLERLEADTIVFVGENKQSTSTDTITVRPSDGGSEISYEAVLDLHGAAKLATPLAKLAFEKIANDTRSRMVEVLNGLPAA
ncbi:SRPBCC family protein [Antrihabitans sp. YC2-6]|uniref:SRPBCC family protein n=1 Tax=Antrihabitans sp. YC2-6 TaxID=2799498 RepID=UPI0018F3E936|nr:SRPBCC family protein [Antrihabitans sp. YC2-6]MBJ8345229.1 SRPBCC family protein [Antrihabitans sp. YC2-6]